MTQMEIIQIQVPSELARRLRSHQSELPRILERGLRYIEREGKVQPGMSASPTKEDVLVALRTTGILVELDPVIGGRYRAGSSKQRGTPVQVQGKPLSEMIVEERGQQWINSQ